MNGHVQGSGKETEAHGNSASEKAGVDNDGYQGLSDEHEVSITFPPEYDTIIENPEIGHTYEKYDNMITYFWSQVYESKQS